MSTRLVALPGVREPVVFLYWIVPTIMPSPTDVNNDKKCRWAVMITSLYDLHGHDGFGFHFDQGLVSAHLITDRHQPRDNGCFGQSLSELARAVEEGDAELLEEMLSRARSALSDSGAVPESDPTTTSGGEDPEIRAASVRGGHS